MKLSHGLSKGFGLLGLLCLLGQPDANAGMSSVKTVPHVDLTRFTGTWYEIAVIPYFFEKGCVATTATYTALPDGKIDVLNRCRAHRLDGKQRSARGIAWVADPSTGAKLRVSFFRPISAPYWIIDLGADYEYAVTANPNRKYLWVLSRTPHMDPKLYDSILARAKDQGFDVSKLVKTLQP